MKKFAGKGILSTHCQVSAAEVNIEKLIKGYEPPKPKMDLPGTLTAAAAHLQGIAKTIRDDENSRNSFIALLLTVQGYAVKDRTRWGRSASGKTTGIPDIKIETPDHTPAAVLEAFILKSFDRTVIDTHLDKLFGYDPNGLERNFIVVYAEAEDFNGLWKKYMGHLAGVDFKYKLAGTPEELKTRYTAIKSARTRHRRDGSVTEIHHLFINMRVNGDITLPGA